MFAPPGAAQVNPFWVVGATKEVIDGHDGIWQQPFLPFLAGIIFRHVQASKQATPNAHAVQAWPDRYVTEYLATYAREIGPIGMLLE